MIVLLNKERVVYEVVELARLKMAGIMRVPSSAVEAKIELKGGLLSPTFAIDREQAKGLKSEQMRDVMSTVYTNLKAELKSRLNGLEERRG